ncbi:MAG: LysR family transcriptional regulator [Candidatus Dactylopiibacterium sp.]|nr:LysR family transcriptional regulator [Candidatus Dactylopiibacterium sp.]
MIPDFKRMAVFAAVVEQGSLSAAGRRLGMSTSAVSQHLRALERHFGVVLLNRSTRKLALTDAGQRVARHAQSMVGAAEAAEQQLRLAHDAPLGQLRMSAPLGFARHVAPALAPLLAAHPALSLHLTLADEMIDLIDARIDLALRAGRLADSSWVAQRVCELACVLCAAPAYLAGRAPIRGLEDLPGQQWLGPAHAEAGLDLDLQGPGEQRGRLRAMPRVTGNNQLSLQQMCVAGLGVAMMVRIDVEDDLRGGRLVPVLPDWAPPAYPLWAVTPRRGTQPAKVRHAIEAMQAYLLTLAGSRP